MSVHRRGRFVSFEGVDGSGKSTQAALLADVLRGRGLTVRTVREPGGTPLGEAIRSLLLDSAPGAVDAAAEVYLFAASRAQLVERVIRPALEAGEWVVADRFLDSSLAYQGGGRGLGIEHVLDANRLAVGDCLPDLTVLVEVAPDVAASRRCAGPDRIEAEGAALQRRVADAYDRLGAMFPERYGRVDADGAVDATHAQVLRLVAERL